MNKVIIALVISIFSLPAFSKENAVTSSFVHAVKNAAEGNGQLSEQIKIDCPSPSASGTFLITKATYDFGKNLGVYVFSGGNGPDAKLDWIGAKFKNDDLSSDVIVGYDFGFTMPNGQFFITVMNSGLVKAGVNKNGTSGVQEITCKAVSPE